MAHYILADLLLLFLNTLGRYIPEGFEKKMEKTNK